MKAEKISDDYEKSRLLVNEMKEQMQFSPNGGQYLIDICNVLINEDICETLTDIAVSMSGE